MKNRDFRISDRSRQTMTVFDPLFETDNNLAYMYRQAKEITFSYNNCHDKSVSAAMVNLSAILHLVYQTVVSYQISNSETDPFSRISVLAEKNKDCAKVLDFYNRNFPSCINKDYETDELVRAFFIHQVMESNPALVSAMQEMMDQKNLVFPDGTKALNTMLGCYSQGTDINDSNEKDLFSFLTRPARLYPDSLTDQVSFIIKHWEGLIPDSLVAQLTRALDYVSEETKIHGVGGAGESSVPSYSGETEYESFTEDRNWMPNVVMIAKNTYVWLDQLSKKYGREINTLDKVPDEELDSLKSMGFTALWLIGLWERSPASRRIKQLRGNPDAESSAYSLKEYSIASRIGGNSSLENLKERCSLRGIRLASDMVPNHTGIDSTWIYQHPEYFISQDYKPFPSYSYTGEDLSSDPDVEIKIEDHYFNNSDAAVTFMKRDKKTGQVKYIYHGNDGTTMPWNDTAQLDFLNPNTREAVIRQIIEVAKTFHIIRFDAAMTLAKRHIQRLWYPKPGNGGDIAGSSVHGLTEQQFNNLIHVEFWREVVDRIQAEVPDTLLLAEAFWMMESYFVRTLGMHRVYNSAFMHMLKNQDNAKYRDGIKATLAFDPQILKRYVNFMSNPDEETAIAQFGDSDKYFGVCTVLATMPGLPMFGHGQIEGFREKYGMEYQRAYWDEKPNEYLINRHKETIFPLLKLRRLFSGCENFQLFDVIDGNNVIQDVYAYTNGDENHAVLVLYNNRYEKACGRIFTSAPKLNKETRQLETVSIAKALRLTMSPRRFVVYKEYRSNLTYLAPSMNIFEEGINITLNGYETRVFTDIHEIEDIDGIYESVYQQIHGIGIADLETEVKLLYLKPFEKVLQNLTSQKFRKDLKSILTGRSSPQSIHSVFQSIGAYCTYIEELEGLLSKLGLSTYNVKPANVMSIINKIENVSKSDVFRNGNLIIADDIVNAVTAAFAVIPFKKDYTSLEDADRLFKTLMLDKFLSCDTNICGLGKLIVDDFDSDINELLQNSVFLDLIGCNEYQGVRWYRGESFDQCMYVRMFSNAIRLEEYTESDEKFFADKISNWLKKSAKAGYKVDSLL